MITNKKILKKKNAIFISSIALILVPNTFHSWEVVEYSWEVVECSWEVVLAHREEEVGLHMGEEQEHREVVVGLRMEEEQGHTEVEDCNHQGRSTI